MEKGDGVMLLLIYEAAQGAVIWGTEILAYLGF
jgi:hypothetical protein